MARPLLSKDTQRYLKAAVTKKQKRTHKNSFLLPKTTDLNVTSYTFSGAETHQTRSAYGALSDPNQPSRPTSKSHTYSTYTDSSQNHNPNFSDFRLYPSSSTPMPSTSDTNNYFLESNSSSCSWPLYPHAHTCDQESCEQLVSMQKPGYWTDGSVCCVSSSPLPTRLTQDQTNHLLLIGEWAFDSTSLRPNLFPHSEQCAPDELGCEVDVYPRPGERVVYAHSHVEKALVRFEERFYGPRLAPMV